MWYLDGYSTYMSLRTWNASGNIYENHGQHRPATGLLPKNATRLVVSHTCLNSLEDNMFVHEIRPFRDGNNLVDKCRQPGLHKVNRPAAAYRGRIGATPARQLRSTCFSAPTTIRSGSDDDEPQPRYQLLSSCLLDLRLQNQ